MNFDLGKIEVTGAVGLDALLQREPNLVKPLGSRKKIASIQDLKGFVRLSSDTLIHRSEKDLWSIRKEADGYYIERLFDDAGEPIKG